MGRRRKKYTPPFEVDIEKLGKGGVGIGVAPDGKPVHVKFAPPGSRLRVAPQQRRKGKWTARRLEMLKPPTEAVQPPCGAFSLCGGCNLQELPLSVQRQHKLNYALGAVATPLGWTIDELKEHVRVHPIRGSEDAYHYRNKVEFSWGNRRILSQPEFDEGVPFQGRFLGFHAPGYFDRIADTDRCWLISEEANRLFEVLRQVSLHEEAPPVWDVRSHEGFWRHAMFREGFATGQLLIVLYTAPTSNPKEIDAVTKAAERLMATRLSEGKTLVGVVWCENDGVADVARGTVRETWGQDWIEERLGDTTFRLSIESFFQTSTKGAVILYDTIREALGDAPGPLYDLYCGIGSIGLYLASQFSQIVGIEEVPQAIRDANQNAASNDVSWASYHASKMETALEHLPSAAQKAALVVDPPRAGLHPKVAASLANTMGAPLVYVACHPPSLGRDAVILRQGGWQLTDLWAVDLFPQTGHIELVGRMIQST